MLRLPAISLLLLIAIPLRADIHILGVASSAGFASGLPAPGSLATIFCTGLTGITGIMLANTVPLPRTLAGVQVQLNGLTSPILAIADLGTYQQINLQVPWELQVTPSVSLAVLQATATPGVLDNVPAADWAVFFNTASGTSIAQHADTYQLVTPDNPAHPGEWIVTYGSNLGPVENTPPTGMPLPSGQLARTSGNYEFYVNGSGTEVNYIGLVPGAIGLYQMNFRVPAGAPTGLAQIAVVRMKFCGFFFVPGCGRGLVPDPSRPVALPVAPPVM